MEKLRIATGVMDVNRLSSRAVEAASGFSVLIQHGVRFEKVMPHSVKTITAIKKIAQLQDSVVALIEKERDKLNRDTTERVARANRREMRLVVSNG